MDTDDLPSSEQSNVASMVLEIATNTDLPVPKMTATIIPVLLIIVY